MIELSLLPIEFYDQLFDYSKNSNIKCDIYEENNNFIIKADIVGAKKEDINLSTKEGHLTISVKRDKENDRKYILRERKYYDEARTLYLGRIDDENIDASYNDGVLTIIVPKSKLNNKTIEIK